MHAKAHMNNHMHTDMHVACTHICTEVYVCSPSLSHMHALSSHVTLKDLSSNDEKHLQKTYMLSEVAYQRPANSINFKMTLKTESLCQLFFIKFLFFREMIGLQKLWKMFFISLKKLFSFSRYSNFCVFFPSFPHFPD